MVEKKIEICEQEVQAAQILSKNRKDGGMCTSGLQISKQYLLYAKLENLLFWWS
jgi:hypothetical protein